MLQLPGPQPHATAAIAAAALAFNLNRIASGQLPAYLMGPPVALQSQSPSGRAQQSMSPLQDLKRAAGSLSILGTLRLHCSKWSLARSHDSPTGSDHHVTVSHPSQTNNTIELYN